MATTKRTVEVELSTSGLDKHGRPQRAPLAVDDSGNVVEDGIYNFELTASADGSEVTAGPLSQGIVDSVANGSNGVTVHLKDLGSISLSEIRQVL